MRTNPDNPSISLVKLRYPEAHRFTSAATSWGCQHESNWSFFESFATDYLNAKFEQSGLVSISSLGQALMGSSINCACHSRSLLEVKHPYKCTCCCKPFSEVVEQAGFCLKEDDCNCIALDRNHSYFYQPAEHL